MVRLLSSYKEPSKRWDPTDEERRLEELLHPQLGGEVAPQEQPKRLSEKSAMTAITCYMDLVDAFFKRDKEQYQSLVTRHESVLREDGNAGLTNQCLTQLVRNQVLHLSNMYSVVPASKVASLLGLSDENAVPAVLIESNVPCQIQDDGMVSFQDTTASDPAPSVVDMAEWMQLIEKVQNLDVAIVTSPKYYALMQKEHATRIEQLGKPGPRGVEDF